MFNNEKVLHSGWTTVWSMLSVVVLAVVFSSLSSFEGGAAEKQHALFTKNHYDHNGHLVSTKSLPTLSEAGNQSKC
jgi:hypothetical protein